MLYITGLQDTLQKLKEQEGFAQPLSEYELQFAKLNPELCSTYPNYKNQLPPYVAIFLVTQSPFDLSTRSEVIRTLNSFSKDERQTLKMMQENHYDIVTQVTLTDVMAGLQSYASSFRTSLKHPLIVSPWVDLNSALTNKSLFKIVGESSKYSAELVKGSSTYYMLDQLYENMMARDVLNRQLHMLKDQKDPSSALLRNDLTRQVKELTALIKKQLPKKINSTMSKYVHRRFTADELRKMRANCFSAKGAKGGKLLTTNLDVLNKSGLARLQNMVKGLKTVGQAVNKGATWLNYGVVAYDTVEAYKNNGNAARAFITGASAVYLTSQAVTAFGGTTALGGLAIGTIVGDAAIGSTLLICSPVIGWVIVVVAGVAVGGYLGYKAKGLAEEVWDIGEDVGGYIYKEASKAAGKINDELQSAWSTGSQWVLDFYGTKK